MPMTADEAKAYYVADALRKAGRRSLNAIYEIGFDFTTAGGTFTATVGSATTAPIAFPPSAAQIKTAMELLATVQADGTKTRGQLGGPYFVEFVGANAGQVVNNFTINGDDLDPAQDVETILWQQGETLDLETDANLYWDNHADDALNYEHRGLLVQLDLIDQRENEASNLVDVQVGQNNLLRESKSQEFTHLSTIRTRVEDRIAYLVNVTQTAKRVTHGGVMTARTPNGLPFGVLRRNPLTGRLE